MIFSILVGVMCVELVVGVTIICGAIQMMRCRSYSLARLVSVLAMLPCSPAWLIGLPIGIWSLIVLNTPHVRDRFDDIALSSKDGLGRPTRTHPARWEVLASLFAVFVVFFLAYAIYFWRGHRTAFDEAVAVAPAMASPAPYMTSENEGQPNTNWVLRAEKPELSESFGRFVLNLDQTQLDSFNKILQVTYQDYIKLERQHTQQALDASGRHVLTIEAFPHEVAKLEDQMWSQLDPLLTQEQQRIARYNLRLHPPEPYVGISMVELTLPGFFGWGRDGALLEIWRVGAWFHWRIQARGYDTSESAPELPAPLKRFWVEKPTPPSE